MTLTIRPVKLKQSIYFRVPNDIADLIGIVPDNDVTLTLKEDENQFLLTYAVGKASTPGIQPEIAYENGSRQLATIARTHR